jgi:hypothetical protein
MQNTVCVRAGRCGAAPLTFIRIFPLSFLSLIVAADALLRNG